MKSDFLNTHFVSQANAEKNGGYVMYGYGQVEPNHLSAQRTGQIYAQLPAAADIVLLEQGQFVKYDYAALDSEGNPTGGLVNFTGKGEWMLVYNEIKLYRDHQDDCEFAMVRDNYQARIYSPYGKDHAGQSRFYNGVDAEGHDSITLTKVDYVDGEKKEETVTYKFDDVTAPEDPYEMHYNKDPYHIITHRGETRMPAGTTMVPRVFKTNVGDIMTLNLVATKDLKTGDYLAPNDKGILARIAEEALNDNAMVWQIAKVTTMPDHQPGVKVVRIK